MNTHSRWADCRMELISAHAALHGADRKTIEALMQAATTDACLDLLESCGLRQKVWKRWRTKPSGMSAAGWAAPIRQGWFFTASSRESCLSPNRRGKS